MIGQVKKKKETGPDSSLVYEINKIKLNPGFVCWENMKLSDKSHFRKQIKTKHNVKSTAKIMTKKHQFSI